MYSEVFRRTVKKAKYSGIHLEDLDILKGELANTVLNYFLYLSIRELLEEDEEFDIASFIDEYSISLDCISFVRENSYKVYAVAKSIDNLKKLRHESDEEFQLLQKCLIIYLGKDLDMDEVMKMREIFGIRRNLKRENKALMIPDLYGMLLEHT
jgi:hypothetical protein